jgi:hypothetical protein
MIQNEWKDWLDKTIAAQPVYPERMRVMLKAHGKTEGEICKTCRLLLRWKTARTYLKCSKSTLTHGPGTDWRAAWPACGLWEWEDKANG